MGYLHGQAGPAADLIASATASRSVEPHRGYGSRRSPRAPLRRDLDDLGVSA